MRKYVMTVAAAAAVALSLTACGAIDLTDRDTTEPAASAGASAAPSASTGKSADTAGVKVADTATLGKVVTDWKGWTLYRFEKDTPKPSKSVCEGECLVKWPAVPYVQDMKIEGVDPKLIGKLTRGDGTQQLTIDGWAAYRFAADAKPGDIKGQGVGGVWFAFTPEGKKAQAVAGTTGGGY
ncbi:hypothetical protein Drose_32700 [Dactylosporangium roseum]|uniref:Lipoprotein n=1 Tax=Dactylosporangium roseum TaxID=47989 RepID=A0ABY5Z419_9ACTN|nr:hypothetical protein [Dactylosporangium roseum]UWZ35805.1 hypothetical protein Drose_32700 [Dactylosporangium roseum]